MAILKNFTSSLIDALAYSYGERRLCVRMKSERAAGRETVVYQYENVPPELFEEFRQAESLGSFYGKRIKGEYKGRKLSDDEAEQVFEGAARAEEQLDELVSDAILPAEQYLMF